MEGAYPRIYPGLASPDCVLDMLFDEGSGRQVVDASQHANHGVMVNMEEGDWAPGRDGKGFALDFDGADEFVRIPHSNSLGTTSSFSLVAWINPDSLATYHGMAGKWGSPNKQFVLITSLLGDGKPYLLVSSNGSADTVYRQCATAISTGSWFLIVGVYDAGNTALLMYRNGVLDQGALVGVVPGSIFGGVAPLRIGSQTGTINRFDGRISGVQLYNRVLSASEILRLYEQPRARYGNPLSIEHMGMAG